MRFPRERGRRHELLLERALCGLSHEAEGELSVLGSGTTDDPDDYEIAGWRGLLRDLSDTNYDDLSNTGDGFGPGDFTAAFRWSRTFAAGETMSFLTQFGGDTPLVDPSLAVVPQPAATLLIGLGLMVLARRPQKTALA